MDWMSRYGVNIWGAICVFVIGTLVGKGAYAAAVITTCFVAGMLWVSTRGRGGSVDERLKRRLDL